MQTQTPAAQPSGSYRFAETRSRSWFPLACLLMMEGAFILVGAVLPLYGLWFNVSLSTDLSSWFLFPTRLLFPQRELNPVLFHIYKAPHPPVPVSWYDTALLFAAFLSLFLVYFLALRYLGRFITRRYLILSLLLFGVTCALTPMVTSSDIFSYIAYARLGILYHLNPLTAVPLAIRSDPVFPYIYWVSQPSAYGPVFAFITCTLQWSLGIFGFNNIAQMILALRLLNLGAHIWSTLLVWSIGGYLQRDNGIVSPRLRMQATFAFAWNPLLLFEACVNAHVDTIVLLFVLLALWSLVRKPAPEKRTYLEVAVLLALATCLKVNVALLFPGLLLFLWARAYRFSFIALVSLVYVGIIIALYAPFWQNGALLTILHVNPGTYRTINTLVDFLAHLYNSLASLFGAAPTLAAGSPAETFAHSVSMAIFIIIYGLLCIRSLRQQDRLRSPFDLISWMALAWLLYSALGSPWFWPWYATIFFGLFALLEANGTEHWHRQPLFDFLRSPLPIRAFAFYLLSLYCFFTWAPYASFAPALPAFRWDYLCGLWTWLPALLIAYWQFQPDNRVRLSHKLRLVLHRERDTSTS